MVRASPIEVEKILGVRLPVSDCWLSSFRKPTCNIESLSYQIDTDHEYLLAVERK
jgi:hypothetical protein